MKRIVLILASSILLSSCISKIEPLSDYKSDTLKIERIGNNIYKHTSYLETRSSGLVPSNGMVYINDNEAVIFDTPVDNETSAELIKWLEKIEIKAVVITHFHVDCLGGLDEFHSRGIKSYATNNTIALAKEDNRILPQIGFDTNFEFTVGNKVVLAKYFGEGHTVDNIIGYVPSEKALFGGCLVKQLNASKGNLNDANIDEWSNTINNIKSEITEPEIEIVIPGHGNHGGIELLDYTYQLFEEG